MIPFKRLLALENDDLVSTLIRVVLLLLESTALHAVDFDTAERQAFQYSIRDIRERLEASSEKTEVLILAGEASKSLQTYGRVVEKFIKTISSEKQSVINMVTESLIKVCAKSEAAGRNLREIAKEMEKTIHLDDTRALKLKMSECLGQICREAAQQEEMARDLRPHIGGLNAGYHTLDQLTGLAGPQDAKAAIQELAATGQMAYVVPLFLKNLDVVNRRFGFASGDEVLKLYSQYLERQFATKDNLYRWRGPCFLAVLPRSGRVETVQAEVMRLTSVPFEKEIESAGRSMLFRISTALTVIPLAGAADMAEIWDKIDAFAAEQIKFKG